MPLKQKPTDVYQGRIDLRMVFEHASEGRGTLRAAMTPSHLFPDGDKPGQVSRVHSSQRVLKTGESETVDLTDQGDTLDVHGQPTTIKEITSFGVMIDPSKEIQRIKVEVGDSVQSVTSGGWAAFHAPEGQPPRLVIHNVGPADVEFSILIAGH